MKNKKLSIYPKMLSGFIKELQTLLDKEGDMPVAVYDSENGYTTANIYPEIVPWYYDGGYICGCDDTRDAHGHEYAHTHFISSKQLDDKGKLVPHPSLEKKHMAFIRIRYQIPTDMSSTLDGIPFKKRWLDAGKEPFWDLMEEKDADVEDTPIRTNSTNSIHADNAATILRVFGRYIRDIFRSWARFLQDHKKKD